MKDLNRNNESFRAPNAGQQLEVEKGSLNANSCYRELVDLESRIGAPDPSLENETHQLSKEVIAFVQEHLPEVSSVAKKNRYGMVSQAHAMQIAALVLEEEISASRYQIKSNFSVGRAQAAISQIKRLLGFAVYTSTATINHAITGQVRPVGELPRLVEIPEGWRRGENGQRYIKGLTAFLERRKESQVVNEEDLNLLKVCTDLMGRSYEGANFSTEEVQSYPYARDIIQMSLKTLTRAARDSQGKVFPSDEVLFNAFQLARGYYYYRNEAEKKARAHNNYGEVPTIVPFPLKLAC